MRNVAIVSTTINTAPPAYAAWATQGRLIVAGDVNTPTQLHDYVSSLDGSYIQPENYFPGCKFVPFRCVQRRNAAIWAAFLGDYDYVMTVDDDNTPAQPYCVEQLAQEIGNRPQTTVGSKSGFLNLGELCIPTFNQRGNPYGVNTAINDVQHWDMLVRSDGSTVRPTGSTVRPTVVVAQAMVIGDPDCDAVERMVNAPDVKALQNRITVTPGVYAAFNSQATLWRADWAPVMAVLPHVGRYDDIFASFIFHRLARAYHVALYAGDPVVIQTRNPHNLGRDLAAELFGMKIVFDFCARLTDAHISSDMPLWLAYDELITAVASLLPADTVKFARAWVGAWKEIKK